MRVTGSGSLTDRGAAPSPPSARARLPLPAARRGRSLALLGCFLATLLSAGSVSALDLFTLWQRPELPLNLVAGQWADYRRQALAEGRRTEDLLRIQCLGQDAEGRWLLEVLPLTEPVPDVFEVVRGEGLRLRLAGAIHERTGGILNVVDEVRLWRGGTVRTLDPEQWRRDPLVTASFSGEFRPDLVAEEQPTVRVISGQELTCRQFLFAATDTTVATSALGSMVQVSSQEVAAAVHPDLPLLGLAYVTERIRSESRLEPPTSRRLPPPQVRIEILECIGFGTGAQPLLAPAAALDD